MNHKKVIPANGISFVAVRMPPRSEFSHLRRVAHSLGHLDTDQDQYRREEQGRQNPRQGRRSRCLQLVQARPRCVARLVWTLVHRVRRGRAWGISARARPGPPS